MLSFTPQGDFALALQTLDLCCRQSGLSPPRFIDPYLEAFQRSHLDCMEAITILEQSDVWRVYFEGFVEGFTRTAINFRLDCNAKSFASRKEMHDRFRIIDRTLHCQIAIVVDGQSHGKRMSEIDQVIRSCPMHDHQIDSFSEREMKWHLAKHRELLCSMLSKNRERTTRKLHEIYLKDF